MAGDRNLEIALRISAELGQARTELDRLNAILDKTGQSSARAGRATREQTAEFNKLLAQIDPTLAALDRLDKQQQKLRQAKLSGLIDDEGFARFNGLLEAQRAGLGKAGEAMHSFSLNSSIARRELGLLVKDIATGQWGRLEQSSLTLASYSGLLGRAFTPLGIAIGGVTAAIGLFAVAAYKGYEQSQALSKAIITTGNYSGVTTGQIDGLAKSLGEMTGDTGLARQVLTELVATGQVSQRAFADAGRAAVLFAEVTGASVKQAVQIFADLQRDPLKAIQKLDEQYHFLTLSIYDQIKALQDQGNAQAAAQLAEQEFSKAFEQRRQELEKNIGSLQREWQKLRDYARFAWDEMLGIGRTDPDHKLDEALKAFTYYNDLAAKGVAGARERADFYNAQVKAFEQARLAAQEAATRQSAEQETQDKGKSAAASIDALSASYDKAIAKQQALDKLSRDFIAIWEANPSDPRLKGVAILDGKPTGGLFDKLAADINKRFSPTKDTTNQLAEAQRQLQEQILQLGSTALGPVSAIWDQYTRAMLAAAAAGGKAIKSGADAGQIQQQVAKVQALAAAARDRALANQRQDLQISLLQATGQQAEAARLQIERQYSALLEDLKRNGDQAGVELVQRLINVGTARAQLQQLQTEVQRVFGEQQRQEQSIQAQQQAGLISEIDARQQLVDLHKLTADQVAKLIPQMEALAAATGDPAAIERVKDLKAQIEQLQLTTNQFQTTFQQGLESGLTSALEGLVERTMTLREAVLNVLRDIARGFEQLAAQALAQKLTSAVAGLFGGGKTKDVGQGAVKLSAASAVLGGASALLGSNADKLQAAATTLLAANAIGAASGFAEGGWTGPGGKYQIAGYVHAGEGVLSQKEIASLGGPSGFYALRSAIQDGSLQLSGYAEGGFVHPLTDAPRLPAPVTPRARLPEPSGGGSRAAPVIFRINNIVDPDLVRSHLRSPAGKQDVLNVINENRSAVRQMVNR